MPSIRRGTQRNVLLVQAAGPRDALMPLKHREASQKDRRVAAGVLCSDQAAGQANGCEPGGIDGLAQPAGVADSCAAWRSALKRPNPLSVVSR
jgi:hypothetical protein